MDGNIKSENTRTFTYDNLGRLKQESEGEDVISYTYDRFGNRSSMNNNGTTTSYTYDLNNRLLTEISGNKTTFYNYDDKGNLYSKRTDETSSATDLLRVDFFGELKNNADSTVELYFYNGLNRLKEVRKGGITAQYQYNAEGIRISKTVNGTTTNFYLDGANVIAESVNGNTTNYVRGVSGIIHSEILGSSNSRKYYTSDGHGNITNLINTSGSVVKTYDYDAFGVEENIDSTDTNPFRYCGEYYDSEINQIYLRARYYSPSLGRFTQSDPVRDGVNWYVYCSYDPVNKTDPFGLLEDGDDRFKESNPVVYASLVDLTNSWKNLDSLIKSGTLNDSQLVTAKQNLLSIGKMADMVRAIGDLMVVDDFNVDDPVYGDLNNTEKVMYANGDGLGVLIGLAKIRAEDVTHDYFGYDEDGSTQNAFKHALWNAYSVVYVMDEPEYVKSFTDAHEYGNPGNFEDVRVYELTRMDFHNNAVGRSWGGNLNLVTSYLLEDYMEEKEKSEELWIIKNRPPE